MNLGRRQMLAGAAAASAGLWMARSTEAEEEHSRPAKPKGGLRQSLVHWCYKSYGTVDEVCELAVKLGIESVELIDPSHWPTLKKHGLTCAIATSHPFRRGPNNPENWAFCDEILRTRIRQAAAFGCPSVITFTGMTGELPPAEGIDNCVTFFKRIMPFAEEQNVNLCLEMLNTRDDSHPMKGHPGYLGNHVDTCIELLERVDSERMKLLFDVYHVQIMDGDLIRRIKQHAKHIGHIHTAGNPGRGELNDQQEINYPAVMRALKDVGYTGFVGHEFIPTIDIEEGLRDAVRVCDV